MPKEIIHNIATGEVTEREFTDEEVAALEAAAAAAAIQRVADEAAETKRVADKASGDAKLKALGFTDDEIAAR
tara:strand:- start:1868 stop:2086 length:219 start_codon:yes stop_codon:yes gene_type:complete